MQNLVDCATDYHDHIKDTVDHVIVPSWHRRRSGISCVWQAWYHKKVQNGAGRIEEDADHSVLYMCDSQHDKCPEHPVVDPKPEDSNNILRITTTRGTPIPPANVNVLCRLAWA